MVEYITRRFLQAIVVIVGVMMVVFFILMLTGDPARLMMGPQASEEQVQLMRKRLGLDQPIYIQFARYMARAARGDFGRSIRYNVPARDIVFHRFKATLQLAVTAMIIILVVSVPAGIVSAVKRYSIFDNVAMVLALLGQTLPPFWLALMLILIFAVTLGWLPSSGRQGFDPRYMILPALSLGLQLMGRMTRLVRSSMLDVLNEDYIRTARAKGLAESSVLLRHALRNAAIPVVTVFALDIGVLLGGAVITETIFAWPGIGQLLIDAISFRDFPIVQADVFYIATVFVSINLIVDILYGFLDPRIRLR